MLNRFCGKFVAAGSMLLVFAVAGAAQTPPKPGPEHKKMEMWVGDWTYEGQSYSTPLGPAGRFSGKMTVRPSLGGFFVEWRGEDKTPVGTTQWFEVDGYDPVNKNYFSNAWGSDGSTMTVTFTIDGNNVPYSGTFAFGGKQFFVRGTIAFAPDLMTRADKREVSADGKTWVPLAESKSVKTKPSPK